MDYYFASIFDVSTIVSGNSYLVVEKFGTMDWLKFWLAKVGIYFSNTKPVKHNRMATCMHKLCSNKYLETLTLTI